MPKDKKYRVFISYSDQDDIIVRRHLYEQLRAFDLNAWFDSQEIKLGKNWREVIEAAIGNAAAITTNFDELLENAIATGAPDLNLPEQVEKASELALPSKQIELIETISNVKELSVELIAYLKKHKVDLDKLRWDVFEHLIAEFLTSHGLEANRVGPS